jgi:hypothetical protein
VAFALCEPLGDEGCRSAHVRSLSSAGHSDCPQLVRWYSTFGGTCAWTMRATMPSCSSRRSCWISIFCEMAGIARSRSEKRSFLPPKRWNKITSFQHPDRVLDPDGRRRGRVLMLTHG